MFDFYTLFKTASVFGPKKTIFEDVAQQATPAAAAKDTASSSLAKLPPPRKLGVKNTKMDNFLNALKGKHALGAAAAIGAVAGGFGGHRQGNKTSDSHGEDRHPISDSISGGISGGIGGIGGAGLAAMGSNYLGRKAKIPEAIRHKINMAVGAGGAALGGHLSGRLSGYSRAEDRHLTNEYLNNFRSW